MGFCGGIAFDVQRPEERFDYAGRLKGRRRRPCRSAKGAAREIAHGREIVFRANGWRLFRSGIPARFCGVRSVFGVRRAALDRIQIGPGRVHIRGKGVGFGQHHGDGDGVLPPCLATLMPSRTWRRLRRWFADQFAPAPKRRSRCCRNRPVWGLEKGSTSSRIGDRGFESCFSAKRSSVAKSSPGES